MPEGGGRVEWLAARFIGRPVAAMGQCSGSSGPVRMTSAAAARPIIDVTMTTNRGYPDLHEHLRTLEERGLYPLLTHKLASASKGALGYFQAGEPREGTGGHGGH